MQANTVERTYASKQARALLKGKGTFVSARRRRHGWMAATVRLCPACGNTGSATDSVLLQTRGGR